MKRIVLAYSGGLDTSVAIPWLKARYDTAQLIEVPMVVGQYHLVSMTLNSLGVQLDPGLVGFPASSR